MMGYQTGDDGVPDRGRVTTLTSQEREILHSLIFDISKDVTHVIDFEPLSERQ